jgi:hypothetical protein
MAELDLAQSEADALIVMEKHRIDERVWNFPNPGKKIEIPLTSADKRESFLLGVTRVQVTLNKVTYQNRARGSVTLIRLDVGGAPHRNPDGREVPCPHVHLYREGFGDKWAYPASPEMYPNLSSFSAAFESFMQHCNITQQPAVQIGMF